MKLIIDIPNEGYDWIKNGFPDNEDKEFLIKAVKNGTPCDTLIKELESRMDYGIEYAQAMSDVIAILERCEEE